MESQITITPEQLKELQVEIAEWPDITEEILTKLHIQSLTDMPNDVFKSTLMRIKEIKNLRNRISKG